MLTEKCLRGILAMCILGWSTLTTGCGDATTKTIIEDKLPFMVLLGEDASIVEQVSDVSLLVIDGEYFTAEEIAKLKEQGVTEVYSYLDVGSLENYRSYYEDYLPYALGDYGDWPEEKWMDVSNQSWQNLMTKRAEELVAKGMDGFFLDNGDVYELYPTEEIYQGLVQILENLGTVGKPVIINGGTAFVERYLSEHVSAEILFAGVNQENVYTSYDFSTGEYGENTEEDREFYTDYLDLVLERGCTAYALEYATDMEIAQKAEKYDRNHGYICYVADNLELKMNE